MAGPQVELLIRRPGHPERRVALEPGAYTLGRAEDSDIVLPDPGVSRRHARIVVGNEVIVEDTGSGNGTWMGTRKLARYVASDGDELGIEPFTLVIRIAGGDPATEEGDAGATLVMPVPAPTPSAAPASARLECISAHALRERALELDPRVTHTLGRSETCTITLPEPAASRVHAEVAREERGWVVRDRNSANGTWVNGKRVREALLSENDVIRIGTVELRFAVRGARVGDQTEPGIASPPTRGASPSGTGQGAPIPPPAAPPPAPSPFAAPSVPAPLPTSGRPAPLPTPPASPSFPPPAAPPAPSPFAQPVPPPLPVAPPVPVAPPAAPVATPPAAAPVPPAGPPGAPARLPSPFAQPVPPPLPVPSPGAPARLPSPFAARPPEAAPPVAQAPAPRGPAPTPTAPPFAHGPAHASSQPAQPVAPAHPPLPAFAENTDISPAPTVAPSPVPPSPVSPSPVPPAPPAPAAARPVVAASPPFAPPVAPLHGYDEEIAIDPRSAREGRRLRSGSAGAAQGGFLSRRINQVTLGLGVLVLLMLGWKAVRDSGGDAVEAEPSTAARPEEAVTEEAASLTPAQAETLAAHMATGMAAFKDRRHVEARRAFQQALEVDASNPDARRMSYLVSEALLLDAMRDVLVARNASDAQRRAAKDAALAAVEAFGGGEADPVREALAKAEALNPGDAELAAATERLDKKISASAAAAGARREEKRRASLADLLAAGQRDFDRGDYAKAIATWNRLLEQDTTRSTQEYYQAEEQIRLAKDRAKSETKRSYADGITAFRAGEYMTARARLEEVVAVDPFNETAAQKLKECQTRLREQASAVFKEARVLEEEVRQPDKAIAAYQRVITLVRDPGDSLQQKAQARLDALLR